MDMVLEIRDTEHVKILLDHQRQRVMAVLRQKNIPMTVKQIAVELGESPAKVHFHVRKLVDIGVLKLVRTEVVHGIVAKYYEPTSAIIKFVAPELDDVTAHELGKSFTSGARSLFLQALQDFSANCEQKTGGPRRLSYMAMHLTVDEVNELNLYLDDFAAKHQKPSKEGGMPYKIFISMIPQECGKQASEEQ